MAAPSPEELFEERFGGAEPKPERVFHHPGLTERVASFGRSTLAHRRPVRALRRASSPPRSSSSRPRTPCSLAKQVLVWLTLTLSADARLRRRPRLRLAGEARQFVRCRCRTPTSRSSTGGARRACSSAPTSRTRTRAGSSSCGWRNSSARNRGGPASRARGTRLAARLFDYAIWGLVLALLLSELKSIGVLPEPVLAWLSHPLLAPMLITGELDSRRGAADRVAADDTRQVAVRLLHPVLDLRCLRVARHAGAARSRAESARSACGGRAWAPGSRCWRPFLIARRPTRSSPSARKRPGTRRRTAWSRTARLGCSTSPPACAGSRRCSGSTAVAWHQPMTQIDRVGASRLGAIPSLPVLEPALPRRHRRRARRASTERRPAVAGGDHLQRAAATAAARRASRSIPACRAVQRAQGAHCRRCRRRPAQLRAGNAGGRRSCARPGPTSTSPTRRRGVAAARRPGAGLHQEAIAAFRKAKQYDPSDRTLDAAIERSQQGIVADFFSATGSRPRARSTAAVRSRPGEPERQRDAAQSVPVEIDHRHRARRGRSSGAARM